MRRSGILAVLVVVGLGCGHVAVAGQTVDVTGTWRLEASRSDPHPFGERGVRAASIVGPATTGPAPDDDVLVISRQADEVRVERGHRADGPFRVAPLDGVARAAAEGGTLRGRVEGETTVLESMRTVTLPHGAVAETRTTERFRVQADGTLLHERRSEQGATVRTWRLVYRRVQ